MAQIGTNVEASVKGDVLTLKINMAAKGKPSSSGKTMIIATTGGNREVPGADHSKGMLKVGVNLFRKPQAAGPM